jgi:transcriptional regulator with XRE-family HTH domain
MVEQGQIEQEQVMNLLPELCRAARGLLDWTQTELAERAGVSRSTIRGFEGGQHDLHRATEAQMVKALEEAGVRFLASDEGPAVCKAGRNGSG